MNKNILKENYIFEISQNLGLNPTQIKNVLDMTYEGDSVAFIARYRKEKTQNLNEDQIRDIISANTSIKNLYEAKQNAIDNIFELGKLTDEILKNIIYSTSLKQVEEIYKPYKTKKKTKAMIAQENGFEPVAAQIKKNLNILDIPKNLLENFSTSEIIAGAQDIIASQIAYETSLRKIMLASIQNNDNIISKLKTPKSLQKLNQKDQDQIHKFEIYKDFSQKVSIIKPYQILAINRGQDLGILNISIEKSKKTYENVLTSYKKILSIKNNFSQHLMKAFDVGYEALFGSVENEILSDLKEFSHQESIDTFKKNLFNLLMTKTHYGAKILALDPGFSAGCKIALLDELGNPVYFDKIFLNRSDEAKNKLLKIFETKNIDIIVIGNGTGVDETIGLVSSLTQKPIYIVNESGASVYSASEKAKKEFPDLDPLDRGTISIGRRFVDPLSELVKVPVSSIGVGMYQHDVPEKKLDEQLGYVLQDTINLVGINVNSASNYVLEYISGIDKKSAKKIYDNRPYHSRQDIKKILSPKVYEQAIGFLRVVDSEEILDNSDIHPEQYELTKYILQNKIDFQNYKNYEKELKNIYEDFNENTLEFILNSYSQIGQDKRTYFAHQKPKTNNSNIEVGQIVEGVVRNVLAFGAFVDIGTKNDGLIHISQIRDGFVSDPKDYLKVGQNVKVKILNIDENTKKIQLSMIAVDQN